MNNEHSTQSTNQLINALAYSRHRAKIIDELVKRAEEAGYDEDLDRYLRLEVYQRGSKPSDETLRAELVGIQESGWDCKSLYRPREALEFISEAGDIWDLSEKELSPQQLRFLKVIRKHYHRWLDKQ